MSGPTLTALICAQCGCEFKRRKGVDRQFCSRECWTRSKRQDPMPGPRTCLNCGSVFTPSYKRRTRTYCGLKCQRASAIKVAAAVAISAPVVAKRGDLLRGRGEGKSYVKREGRHEHRVIAEQMLGRSLAPGEVVHHKDGNHRNNHPSNLQVFSGQSEHMRHHQAERCAKNG